jgi:hypothetical protein
VLERQGLEKRKSIARSSLEESAAFLPPSLSLAVACHLKPSVSVESSLKVCCNSMSLDTVHHLFLNLSERALDFKSDEQRPLPNYLFFCPILEMRIQMAA